MGSYRYIFADTITGRPLAEYELVVQSFDNDLGEGGAFSGDLSLGTVDADWKANTEPFKTSLYVIRDDNQVVWGGPVNANPKNGDDKASIKAETFEQFLKRRKIKTNLTYTSVDVFSIVRDILDVVQGHLGGNLNIAVATGSAGYNQTVAYKYEDRAVVWDELMRLAGTGNKFEAYVTCGRDVSTGWFTKTLNLATPQANTDLPPIVLEQPGNVLDYTWPEAGEANAVAGLGKGDGVAKLIYEAIDAAGQLAAGYPLVDADLSLGEEDDLTRLTARTQLDLASRLVDNVIPEVTIDGDAPGLEFGSFPLGVPARLRAVSLYHPANDDGSPTLDVTRRVVGWSVTPPSAGGIEQVTLTLANGIGRFRPPLNEKFFRRWLKRLEMRQNVYDTRR